MSFLLLIVDFVAPSMFLLLRYNDNSMKSNFLGKKIVKALKHRFLTRGGLGGP